MQNLVSTKSSNSKNIHMIGCAGGIGKWMLDKIFDNYPNKSKIYCYDVNANALAQLPDHIEKCHIESDTSYTKYQDQFKESDWIILGVPLNYLSDSLRGIAKYAKSNSLFVTLTSTQVDALNILKKHVSTDSRYIGCHPLFGISLHSPVSQVAILVDYNEADSQQSEFKKCLNDTGLFINSMTAKEHDKNMSVVQALTHFSYLTFAHVLGNSEYEVSRLTQTTTPSFQFLLAFASRVLRIAPTTTGTIQATEDAKTLRDLFQKSALYLNERFSSEMSVEACAEVIEEIRQPFQAKDTSKIAGIAKTAVTGQQNLEELFYKYIKSAKPFVFKNKLTQKLHIVQLTSMQMDTLTFTAATKIINKNGVDLYASALNKEAELNYKNQGISITKQENLNILKKNVELVSAGFLKTFYSKQIFLAETQLTFSNPNNYNSRFFNNWLPMLNKDIKSIECVNESRSESDSHTITLNINFLPNTGKNILSDSIKRLIEIGITNS